jgi:hypothetical protein
MCFNMQWLIVGFSQKLFLSALFCEDEFAALGTQSSRIYGLATIGSYELPIESHVVDCRCACVCVRACTLLAWNKI